MSDFESICPPVDPGIERRVLGAASNPAIPWVKRPFEDDHGDLIYTPGLALVAMGAIGVRLNHAYEPVVYERLGELDPQCDSLLMFANKPKLTYAKTYVRADPIRPFSLYDTDRINAVQELCGRYLVQDQQRQALEAVCKTAESLHQQMRLLEIGSVDSRFIDPNYMEGAAIIESLVDATRNITSPQGLVATAK